jgi:hypothetical protein
VVQQVSNSPEIVGAWLRRGHGQIAVEFDSGEVFILDSAGQVSAPTMYIGEPEWDELYPETDFS